MKQQALAICAVLAFALPASAQGIKIAKPPERSRTVVTNTDPGDDTEVDLATLAVDIGHYDHKHVRTRGVLALLDSRITSFRDPQMFLLRSPHGRAELLLIPSYGLIHDDLRQLAGSGVSVRGVVRMLRARGESIADAQSPELPPLPLQAADLPRVSLTVLGIARGASKEEDVGDGSPLTRQILRDPARFAGKPIRVVGQFRGRNLFGDLPGESKRSASDWVLKEGPHALWIVGRAPKGHGFSLDVEAKGDSARWLEVEGKPEVVEGVVFLRASRVTLAPRRKDQQ